MSAQSDFVRDAGRQHRRTLGCCLRASGKSLARSSPTSFFGTNDKLFVETIGHRLKGGFVAGKAEGD